MAVAADGGVALSATGQLHSPARFHTRNGRLVKFSNGELMGKKLKFAPIQQRKNNAVNSHVCNSVTADLAGENKLRDLEMEKRDPRTVVAIILGGGAGTRLFPLTKRRAKPAHKPKAHAAQ